jgi:5'-phosphate synthase pdxT subunit
VAAVVTAHKVGVLSLQGDFACHHATLAALGATPVRVSLPRDLEGLEALVLPGGESTTMIRLLEATGLRAPLEKFVRERPVLGTCAGVILLGRGAAGLPGATFEALDVEVERNAYGRQVDSFSAVVEVAPLARTLHGVFIRAPRLVQVGPQVEVIARLAASHGPAAAGEPVGVRQGQIVGLCFHPELTRDAALHAWFLSEVAGLAVPAAARTGETLHDAAENAPGERRRSA